MSKEVATWADIPAHILDEVNVVLATLGSPLHIEPVDEHCNSALIREALNEVAERECARIAAALPPGLEML
jgi:hypothetical protein